MPAFSFEKIDYPREPTTGEIDEQADMFGQGRSLERRGKDARVFVIISGAIVLFLAVTAVCYSGGLILKHFF